MMRNVNEVEISIYHFIPTCMIPREESKELKCNDCIKEDECSLRIAICNDFDVKFTSLWKID